MTRRKAYTGVRRTNFHNPAHVSGMGDRVFRGFQCLNKECTNFIFEREDRLNDFADFSIECTSCGYRHATGEIARLYDYELVQIEDGRLLDEGAFTILHDDYLKESGRFKYCVLCGALKPLECFGLHASRASKRQGECSLCKQVYNSIKNGTRLVEQHREASQKRRLYVQFGPTPKLDFEALYRRFDSRCFKCGCDLSADLEADSGEAKLGNLDHTLPVYLLWPATSENATLLCRQHNAAKAERWPGAYYSDEELRRLSALTGIDYRLLAGPAVFNPGAVNMLRDGGFVEGLFAKFARYPNELLHLRNRILEATAFDFLDAAANLSPDWRRQADGRRGSKAS
jgi:hypothetical protein